MKKLLLYLLVGFTFLQWTTFAEATYLNEAYKNHQSNIQVKGVGNYSYEIGTYPEQSKYDYIQGLKTI
ncbi:MAG: hypothetical protein HRT51_05175 [Colwellia sp.]|nr:hypothetical protein [Colwellia sp.]